MAYVVRLQKIQQERRLACPIQEKIWEHCDKWSMPPEGALLLDKGQIIEEVVVTYIDCRECKDKGVQTHKNQGQGPLLERQVKNMQCNLCQKTWNWRNGEARKGEITKVQYIECERKNTIEGRVLE